jgi:hypothetical protein
MRACLFVVLASGLVLVGAGQSESRGQEKKTATPTGIKVQMELEEINVKGQHVFITGTFRITQPEGGVLISSKFVGVPVTADAKIKLGDKEGKVADLKADMSVILQLVEDQGGLVVVGIQTIGKGDGKKAEKKKP